MSDPTIIRRDALLGRKIAISVSGSADLARLGLGEEHCRLVVAEVGRAIMLAGGTILYGGDLRPDGYTWVLVDEARRFGGGRPVLELCLAEPAYRPLREADLTQADRTLGDIGKVTLITSAGSTIPVADAHVSDAEFDAPAALTAMRQYVSGAVDGRLIVGGKLSGYSGTEPGVIEEARLTWEAGKPVLVAGGYGGAAAAIARHLRPQDFDEWAPQGFPQGADDERVTEALEEAGKAYHAHAPDFSAGAESALRTITISHRPGDIATAAVQLLSRLLSGDS